MPTGLIMDPAKNRYLQAAICYFMALYRWRLYSGHPIWHYIIEILSAFSLGILPIKWYKNDVT